MVFYTRNLNAPRPGMLFLLHFLKIIDTRHKRCPRWGLCPSGAPGSSRERRSRSISDFTLPVDPSKGKPPHPSIPHLTVVGPTRAAPRWRWRHRVLTLDVDGDRGLLPTRNGFVSGAADDALTVLDVGGCEEKGAHDALSLAITEKRLQGEKQG